MIPRLAEKTLMRYARGFPVICITGPRQSGKTTLVKTAFPKKRYLSLEDPDTALLARSDPRGFLETWPKGLILDEAQYVPELFVYLKTMVDRDPKPGKYIITGSQQFNLMAKVTESLAGRAAFLTLLPFSTAELASAAELGSEAESGSAALPVSNKQEKRGFKHSKRIVSVLGREDPWGLMLKGLYPPLYDRDISARDFYSAYIAGYVERDIRQLINVKDLYTFQNFIRLCASRIGGILNLSSLAGDCGITHNTAKAWISILEIAGLVFLLKPYYKNYGKRLIKSPKLYFFDPGLACRLLGIQTREQLFLNPLRGSLFEGFIISEMIKNRLNRGEVPDLWYWRDNAGLEIDCLVEKGSRLLAMEIKSGVTFNKEMIKNLQSWEKINAANTGGRLLVSAGSQKTSFKGIKIIPWKDVVYL